MSKLMTNFVPSLHGFHFFNYFANVIFDNWLGSWTTHGRCGGMAFAALDYYHAGIPIPMHVTSDFPNGYAPDVNSTLARYIYDRLMDSFNWNNISMFHNWTWKRDHYTCVFGDGVPQLTKQEEFPKLRAKLQEGPQPIGLVGATNITEIGDKNHQVVAVGYEYDEASGKMTVIVYDNNHPDEYVYLTSESNQLHFYSSKTDSAGKTKEYRGFFVEEYSPKTPAYIDLSVTKAITPDKPYPALGDRLEFRFKVKNSGEYPSHIKNLYLSAIGPSGENLDSCFGSDNNGNPLKPGEEREYVKAHTDFGTTLGEYTFRLSYTSEINGQKIGNLPNAKELKINIKSFSASILNTPPYVENVMVFKGSAGKTPIGFAEFDNTNLEECERVQLKYNARWLWAENHRRKLEVAYRENTFPVNGEVYLFIKYGTAWGNTTAPGKMGSTALKLTGAATGIGAVNIQIVLKEAFDSREGVYYWGSFTPPASWQSNIKLTLEIQGTDVVPHAERRSVKGNVLDSKPDTEAYVDVKSPVLYPILNYEPGTDTSHSIDLSPKLLTLPVDALEANNSFTAATRVNLALPDQGKDSWAIYNALTFNNSTDIDYFNIEYHSSPADDACVIDKPVTRCISEFAHLYITEYPPRFLMLADVQGGGCLGQDIFKSDAQGKQLYLTKGKGNTVLVYNPTRVFPDKKLYLSVKNPFYSVLGALKYDLKIGYQPMQTVLSCSGLPYIEENDIRRKFLKRFFDAIDLPRPGDYLLGRIIDKGMPIESAIQMGVIVDYKAFVEKYRAFIMLDSTRDGIAGLIKEEPKGYIGRELCNLGKVALEQSLLKEAEELLEKGSGMLDRVKDKDFQKGILDNLGKVYTLTGQKEKLKKLNATIKTLPI